MTRLYITESALLHCVRTVVPGRKLLLTREHGLYDIEAPTELLKNLAAAILAAAVPRQSPAQEQADPRAHAWICLQCQSTRQGFHFTDCKQFERSLNDIN